MRNLIVLANIINIRVGGGLEVFCDHFMSNHEWLLIHFVIKLINTFQYLPVIQTHLFPQIYQILSIIYPFKVQRPIQDVQDKASNIYLITGACAWFQKNVNRMS